MPVQIGAKSHNFTDPTGLLNDCHRRIEMFMQTLQAVGSAMEVPPTEDVRQALETALRYFAQAAPKHTADEEESLFPRMRRVDSGEVRSAFGELEELEHDHREAESLHAEVERLGKQYLGADRLPADDIDRFRKSVASLLRIYERHIQVEDEKIFPLAARILSDHEKSAIAQEMANRRSVKIDLCQSPKRVGLGNDIGAEDEGLRTKD